MSGLDDMRGRRWSARQRFVVLTFPTTQAATTFDLSGVTPIGVVDVTRLDGTLIDRLMWEVRQLIDQWDDGENRIGGQDWHRLEAHIASLRASLFELRQGALS